MASSPPFKIYRDGEYVASVKYVEDAAMLVAGSQGQVRYGHSRVLYDTAVDGAIARVTSARDIIMQRLNYAAQEFRELIKD